MQQSEGGVRGDRHTYSRLMRASRPHSRCALATILNAGPSVTHGAASPPPSYAPPKRSRSMSTRDCLNCRTDSTHSRSDCAAGQPHACSERGGNDASTHLRRLRAQAPVPAGRHHVKLQRRAAAQTPVHGAGGKHIQHLIQLDGALQRALAGTTASSKVPQLLRSGGTCEARRRRPAVHSGCAEPWWRNPAHTSAAASWC